MFPIGAPWFLGPEKVFFSGSHFGGLESLIFGRRFRARSWPHKALIGSNFCQVSDLLSGALFLIQLGCC